MERTIEQDDLDKFDPVKLRILGSDSYFDSVEVQAVEVKTSGSPTKKRYIPPIAEDVFNKLNQLPGRCLPVYMVLKQLCKLQRTKTVVLTSARLAESGVTRDQKADALRRLVDSGFIQVSATNGKNPLVTLLEV